MNPLRLSRNDEMNMNELKKNIISKMLFLSGLLLALLLSGCVGKMEQIPFEPVELPVSFSITGSVESEGKWWQAFNDEDLSELIELALGENFSINSSWERLNQLKAQYRKSSASLFPALDGKASGTHSIEYVDGTSDKTDNLFLGLSASYEVDLWGQIESNVKAARLDMEATQADLDTAAMTLAAEVAKTWYLLIQQTATLVLLEQQIATNSKALELITTQFRVGKVPFADVLQQRQLIESQEGEKMLLVSQKGQAEHGLNVLLGQVPGTEIQGIPTQLIALPKLPDTGIPSEFIQARPDIRSSLLTLQAADQRVAVAVANQYPSLRFTASLDTIHNSTSTIFSDYLASIMAGLTAPLFDGGSRKAEVARTRAVAAEKMHDYGQTILTAIGEVEDALLKEQQQQKYIKSLHAQLELATKTMEQVKERYLKGVADYQRVLTALTSLQSLQQSLITAQKNLLFNRIELCRALGRGWEYSNTETYTKSQDAIIGKEYM